MAARQPDLFAALGASGADKAAGGPRAGEERRRASRSHAAPIVAAPDVEPPQAAVRQFDLFSASGAAEVSDVPCLPAAIVPLDPQTLSDDALIAAVPHAGLAEYAALVEEVARRRLTDALPALQWLCRRFTALAAEHMVPEQLAALAAIEAIGGTAAGEAVSLLIRERVIVGPGLRRALPMAARLGATLPPPTLALLLDDADPGVRAEACRCVRPGAGLVTRLVDLLADKDRNVVREAACGLGRLGREEALAKLKELLAAAPTAAIIEATLAVADDECLVLLARAARREPRLAVAVLFVLDEIDTARSRTIAAALRRDLPSS